MKWRKLESVAMKKTLPWILLIALCAVVSFWRNDGPVNSLAGEEKSHNFTKVGTFPKSEATRGPSSLAQAATELRPSIEEVAEFRDWARTYLAVPESEKPAMLKQGKALAIAHTKRMAELIRKDPEQAIANAVPMVIRQDLPLSVVELLEERVNIKASLTVNGNAPLPGQENSPDFKPYTRVVSTTEGEHWNAFVYGRRGQQRSLSSTFVNGISVGYDMAVSDSRVRQLEIGERPVPGERDLVESCPVSDEETEVARTESGALPPITEETPAFETAERIIFVCSSGHIEQVAEEYATEEERLHWESLTPSLNAGAGSGAPTGTVGSIPSTVTTGQRSLLYVRVTFPDHMIDPQSEAECHESLRQMAEWVSVTSYGRLYYTYTVTPLIVLPYPESWYMQRQNEGASADSILRGHAITLARAVGYDNFAYNNEVIRWSGVVGPYAGSAGVGGRNINLKTSNADTLLHELGHNLGLWHANYWQSSPPSSVGPGTNAEYGNTFDVLGSAGNIGQFTASFKNAINWLPNDTHWTVHQSGVYRIHQYDVSMQDPVHRYALRIRKDVERDYWAEFRQLHTGNTGFMNGLMLTWDRWGQGNIGGSGGSPGNGSNGGAQLLDMTPGSFGNGITDTRNDSALWMGRTFSDPDANVHITPIAKNDTTPPSTDVYIHTGDHRVNVAPTLSINASSISVAANTSVTFTATASDPDGDSIAYAWVFNDGTYSTNNSAVQTKSWSTEGNYQVLCTASDMKGKRTTRAILVTVGSPTTFSVSGNLTGPDGQPIEGVYVASHVPSNNTSHPNSSTFRGTWSDSDGNYTLTNLAAGSYVISPNLYPNVFSPSNFTNPVVVGPSITNRNFGSSSLPSISLRITDATANEGSTPGTGTIRIERTGSTANALRVQIFNTNTGTATRNTDYTLSPAPTASTAGGGSGTSEYTIPAGASFLDITVTPVNDSVAEGTEYASLDFANTSGGYILAGSAVARVEIIDDENGSLPVVKLTSLDHVASESGGDTAQFRLERNGSTTTNLTVNLTMSGIATNNADFTLPSSVVIPAGSTFTNLSLIPIDDVVMEGTETAIVAIASSAAYARDTLSNSQTVTIHDNDLPTVTIEATDSSVTEVAGGSGVFTISRTGGDPYRPLTVDYAISGRAVHGADYRRLEGRAVIPAGASSTTVEIYPYDDTVDEGIQDIILRLRSATTYVIGGTGTASMSITDNDDSQVYLKMTQSGVVEPASGSVTAVTFQVIRPASGSAITVSYAMSGTAVNGVDYTSLPGTIAFGTAETTKTINVSALADTLFEDAESVTLTLLPGAGYTVMGSQPSSATGFILDGDQPTIDVSAVNTATSLTTAGSETSGSLQFLVSRKTATASNLVVNYTMSGTATEGVDYTGTTGTVTILANTLSSYITIVPVNDSIPEGVETIVMNITPASGTYGLRTATATMFFGDNDVFGSGSVAFAASSSITNETAGIHQVPVNVTGTPSGPITVSYRLSAGNATGGGYDFTMNEGVLVFAPGVTTQNIPITIHQDILAEPSETISLQLYNVNGGNLGTSTHTVTLHNVSMPEAFTDAPSNLLANSVTLNGRAIPNGLTTNVWFEYGPTAAYGNVTAPQVIASGSTSVSFSAALSGFAPGGYHFRSVAQNSMGTTYGIKQVLPSSNANLVNLTTDVGTLSPAFSPSTTAYTVSVPMGTTSIMVSPTSAQADAALKINGVTVASGSSSSPITIGSGTTSINVVVTAQDGVTVRTYTINVSVVIVAKFFSVTYNGNGNTGGSVPTDGASPYLSDSVVTTLGNTGGLTKDGFAFVGWNTSPTGSGLNYTIGSTFLISGDLTLYAQWNSLPLVNAGPDQKWTLGAAAWQPSNLSIQAWYDASDASTIISSGGLVSEWRDKSGFERHAIQSDDSRKPTTGINNIGGNNVVSLNGSSQFFFVNLDFLANTSHSAFIVTKTRAFRNIYGAADGNKGANSLHVGFSSSTQYRMSFWGNSYSAPISTSFIPNSGNLLNFVWTRGVSKQIFANGTLQASNTSAGVIGEMAGGGRIGSCVGQALYGGDLAEIIFVTGTVSPAERERMEGYLAHKWQLQEQLPADHAFKYISPVAPVTLVTLDGTVTDSDSADSVSSSWTVHSGPNDASVVFDNASAVDTTAAFLQAGVYTLRLTAGDGVSNVTDEAIITIRPPSALNTPPVWTGVSASSFSATEDAEFASTLADLASDIDGDTLTFSKVSGPAWISVAANGALSGMPTNSDVGSNTLTVRVSDSIAPAVQTTLSIIVINTNDAPTWIVNPIAGVNANEDAVYNASIAGSAQDVDAGAALVFAKMSGPSWLNVSPAGVLSGTPYNANVGDNRFVVSVSDGIAAPVNATLEIIVNNTNDAPTWTVNPIAGANAMEDSEYTGNISGNVVDEDTGATLSFSKVSGPAWLNVSAAGALSGSPDNGNVGVNRFVVSVSDGIAAPVNAALDITVINTNDAPIWTVNPIVGANATEDTIYQSTIADRVVDVDAGDALIFTKLSGPVWLNVSPSGGLSGTPAKSDVGVNAFSVSVSDGMAAPVIATLTISVVIRNDAPAWIINPILGAAATEDVSYAASLAGSAMDPDAGTTLTYAKVSGPAWLSVSANGVLSGTPTNGEVGTNTFVVSVSDGIAAPIDATLTISVINANDAPLFLTDPIIGANASENVTYSSVTLAGSATDPDVGDTMTFSKISGPAWLSVAADGALSGTPPAGSAGLNSFVVSVTDAAAASVNATLNISVLGLPLPWLAVDIGTGALPGSTFFNAGAFTQTGSGVLGGTSSRFRFAYQTISGDGQITARITSLQNTGSSSRVGVMIRESLAANSREIFMGLTGGGAYRWTTRLTTGGSTNVTSSNSGTVPNTWVRINRTGSTITVFRSNNGTSWVNVGNSSSTSFGTNCFIGLAVGSGSNTTLNTSQFSNISVTP